MCVSVSKRPFCKNKKSQLSINKLTAALKKTKTNFLKGTVRCPGYVMPTKVIFNPAEVSFFGGSLFSETSACSLASLSGS